jgi:trehalose-phosphatase
VHQAAALLRERLAGIDGTLVEDKTWSLSAHYRLAARDRVDEVVAATHAVASALGLHARDGKEIVELRAPVDVDKGTAVLALLAALPLPGGRGAVLLVGDDVTDEDAFRRVREAFPAAVTVRVGPPDVVTRAASVVTGPSGVHRLLERIRDLRRH